MGDKLLKITAVAPGPGRLIMEPYVGKQQDAIKHSDGLFRPLNALRDMPRGQVVSIDPKGYLDHGEKVEAPCQPGDWIMIGVNTQTSIIVDGKEFWETHQANVKAVLTVEFVDEEEPVVNLQKANEIRTGVQASE